MTRTGFGLGSSRVRELHAQTSGSAAATTTQRVTAQTRRQRSGTKPFILILLGRQGRRSGGTKTCRLGREKPGDYREFYFAPQSRNGRWARPFHARVRPWRQDLVPTSCQPYLQGVGRPE